MTKKYLITGGCGFLGSNLAAEVLKSGNQLVVFDNLSRLGSEKNLSWLKTLADFDFQQGDIRNSTEVEQLIKSFKPDIIFHLAGQVAMTTSIKDPFQDFSINTIGTLNLLLAVKNYNPDCMIIYSSTNKVYGDLEQYTYEELETRFACQQHTSGFDEATPLNFQSPYGCSKGAAEQYMLDFYRIYGIRTIVFRHSSICGFRQYCTYDQGWVAWFIKQALETQKNPAHRFEISGTGKQVRDVLFAPDLVRCYLMACEHINNCEGQAFNIGGGFQNSLSLLELFKFLEELLPIKLKFDSLPFRLSDQKLFIANTQKADKYFKWQPAIAMKEGLSNLLDWMANS